MELRIDREGGRQRARPRLRDRRPDRRLHPPPLDGQEAVVAAMIEHHTWPDYGMDAGAFARDVHTAQPAAPGDVLRTFYRAYAARFEKPSCVTANLRFGYSTISGNGTAMSTNNGRTLGSYGNNLFNGNTTDTIPPVIPAH